MYRILVIDDDSIMQKTLRDSLKPEGHEVVVAADGRTGLRLAAGEKPDLILLDVNLPDRSGIEVCRALKSDPATRHIPVLILTGHAREVVQRVEGLNLGADDYLIKPISPRALAARVRSILRISAKPTSGGG